MKICGTLVPSLPPPPPPLHEYASVLYIERVCVSLYKERNFKRSKASNVLSHSDERFLLFNLFNAGIYIGKACFF